MVFQRVFVVVVVVKHLNGHQSNQGSAEGVGGALDQPCEKSNSPQRAAEQTD